MLDLNWSTARIRHIWRLRNKRLQNRGIAAVRQGRGQASFSSRNDRTERQREGLLNEGVSQRKHRQVNQGARVELFLCSKCLNEPSLCCSTITTNTPPPPPQKGRTKQTLQGLQRRHYQLSFFYRCNRKVAVRELCNKPQSV